MNELFEVVHPAILNLFESLITLSPTGPAKPGEVDERTMVHWKNTVFCRYYSPERRHKLMCGYDVSTNVEDEKKQPVNDKITLLYKL